MRNTPQLRAWSLLQIASAEYAGLGPVSRERFHMLFFITNALANYYGIESYVHLVYKWQRGPFYPDAQWEIGRLIAQGLINLDDFKLVSDAENNWNVEQVSITKSGADVVRKLRAFDEWLNIERLQVEVAQAFAEVELPEHVIQKSDVYKRPGSPMIDFSGRNESVIYLSEITDFVKHSAVPSKLDVLRIYSKLLGLRAA